jgi:hypothetical protein
LHDARPFCIFPDMSDRAIHVKLSIQFPREGILRQTPGGNGRWGNCVFHVNEAMDSCDYWVIYDSLKESEQTSCDPRNVLLITAEPPSLASYHPDYLSKFSTVVTAHTAPAHPNLLAQQQALPWHVGRRQSDHQNLGFGLGYDILSAMDTPRKDRVLSLVCSTKAFSREHRQRNRLVDALQERLGSKLEVFGRGRREVEDKWDALAPYKYTIVLENSQAAHYWTEKLSDAFLAETYPFYYGCPNLSDYFAEASFGRVDPSNVDATVDTIERCIANETYGEAKSYLREAKALVLDRYNLFAMLSGLCSDRTTGKQELVRLHPRSRYQPFLGRAIRRLGGLFSTKRRG